MLGRALSAETSKANFCSKTTALAHAEGKLRKPQLDELVEDFWKQIVTNWVEGGCQWSGQKNWCWRRSETLSEQRQDEDDEVRLNRRLARGLTDGSWSNETPTGSGMGKEGREPGGLDLAHHDPSGHVTMIELKTKDSNPMSAAFQLVGYGLFLVLARFTHTRLVHKSKPIEIAEEWRDAKSADLRVLAPAAFYERYLTLGWFQDGLDEAVKHFAEKRNFAMTFQFREFDDAFKREPTEKKLLEALARPIEWR